MALAPWGAFKKNTLTLEVDGLTTEEPESAICGYLLARADHYGIVARRMAYEHNEDTDPRSFCFLKFATQEGADAFKRDYNYQYPKFNHIQYISIKDSFTDLELSRSGSSIWNVKKR